MPGVADPSGSQIEIPAAGARVGNCGAAGVIYSHLKRVVRGKAEGIWQPTSPAHIRGGEVREGGCRIKNVVSPFIGEAGTCYEVKEQGVFMIRQVGRRCDRPLCIYRARRGKAGDIIVEYLKVDT